MAVEEDIILKRHDTIKEHYYDVKIHNGMGGTITIRFVNGIFQGIKVPKGSFTLNHELLTEKELERLHFLWHEVEVLRSDKER